MLILHFSSRLHRYWISKKLIKLSLLTKRKRFVFLLLFLKFCIKRERLIFRWTGQVLPQDIIHYLRPSLHVGGMKSHPGMKLVPGWDAKRLHVSFIPGWNHGNFIPGWVVSSRDEMCFSSFFIVFFLSCSKYVLSVNFRPRWKINSVYTCFTFISSRDEVFTCIF